MGTASYYKISQDVIRNFYNIVGVDQEDIQQYLI